MRPLFFLGLLMLVGVGCSEEDDMLPLSADEELAEILIMEPIGIGMQASLTDTTETVITTPEAWTDMVAQLRFVEAPDPIDFEQYVALVVAIPTESAARIEFDVAESIGGTIRVDYFFHEPADDCIPMYATMVPFSVVKVRKAAGPWVFNRISQIESCTFK